MRGAAMQDLERVITQLKLDEGLQLYPYRCPAGYLTIGYGLNLDSGITHMEADLLLRERVRVIHQVLSRIIPAWPTLTDNRQAVLINMAYNLGISGLRGFKRMLAALDRCDYATAAKEMLDSSWARQVPKRAERLAKLMELG